MENIKTIPMSTEDIQELFLNQDVHYSIDLKNSKLKGEAFITYIANMQMNCSIIKDQALSSEEKIEILKFFFSFRQTIKCDTLLLSCAHVLLKARNIGFEMDDSWLLPEEMDLFIKENSDLVLNASKFLDSSLTFIPSFNNNYRKAIFEPSIDGGVIKVIEESDFIGVNILGLYTIPGYIEHFLAASESKAEELVYYKNQVELLQWNRMPLFQIISSQTEDTFLMGLCHLILSSEESDKQLFDELVTKKLPKLDDSHI